MLAGLAVLAGAGVTLALVLGGDDGDGDGGEGGSRASTSQQGGEGDDAGRRQQSSAGPIAPETVAENYMEAVTSGDLDAVRDLACAEALAQLGEVADPQAAFESEYEDLVGYQVIGKEEDGPEEDGPEDYLVTVRFVHEEPGGDGPPDATEKEMRVVFEEGDYKFCGFQGSASAEGGG